jgi:CRISPR-associated protein Csc3
MYTLLQNLLIETLDKDEQGSVLREFINTILPALEREFALTPALGGIEKKFASKPDQSLLVHVLNGLLVAWNLSKELAESLSELEQRLLCLGFTLHDYDKYFHHRGEEAPEAHQISEILRACRKLAEMLDFGKFWSDWESYSLDICYLAQNTQRKNGSNHIASSWENNELGLELQLYSEELDRLCDILAFGDVAVHMNNPADIITKTGGDRLRESLEWLGIDRKLVYHRLRDSRGLVTNQIHNAVVNFTKKRDWKPILYFAQGTVYLTPDDANVPSLQDIQEFVWENILKGDEESNLRGLEEQFRNGDVGFIRSEKGLKIAPLTRELFAPEQLICLLPDVFIQTVKNIKDPATPKRLEKLDLDDSQRQILEQGADVWADRLAELIIFVQKEFFVGNEDFIHWTLNRLNLQNTISLETTKIQKGGVNYGWYQAAACYIATTELDRHPNSENLSDFFNKFGEDLASWAKENNFLPCHENHTYQAVCDYLAQYLEVFGWEKETTKFAEELTAYAITKAKNKFICSISSGEFAAEEQLESVVLFKPQQYSNKNTLGGRRIKRGISKIWSLEMIMRQAYWAVPAGKLEEQKPVFLYIFPAYVYSPQIARAIGRLVKKLKKNMNLSEITKQWRNGNMNYTQLQYLLEEEKEPKAGRYQDEYSNRDLPFMAMTHTQTRGKTNTDAWVEPAFIALILPILFGVKVVATPSSDPIYASDEDFLESVRLDGVAGFWHFLGLKTDLRLQELEHSLKRLLVAYSLHLETHSSPRDARWQALNGTVREVMTNVLNVFSLANERLRSENRGASTQEVFRYWEYAQILVENPEMYEEHYLSQLTKDGTIKINNGEKNLMDFVQEIAQKYRKFYRVGEDDSGNVYYQESSHSILRPISIAFDAILRSPADTDKNSLITIGSGEIRDALERLKGKEVSKRILRGNKHQELHEIREFMKFCVEEILGDKEKSQGYCKGDRALLQENRNRIKSGAEFAYRWLALQEKSAKSSESKSTQKDK